MEKDKKLREDLDSKNQDNETEVDKDGQDESEEEESESESGDGAEESDESEEEEQLVPKKQLDQALARAKKAEAKLKDQEPKEPRKEVKPKAKTEDLTLSQSDVLYLAKAEIHEEDVEELVRIAKIQNKTLKETHNLSWVRSWLAERDEERATAEATATKNRPGSNKVKPSQVMEKARKGELPENPEDLADAAIRELENRAK